MAAATFHIRHLENQQACIKTIVSKTSETDPAPFAFLAISYRSAHLFFPVSFPAAALGWATKAVAESAIRANVYLSASTVTAFIEGIYTTASGADFPSILQFLAATLDILSTAVLEE